MAIADGKVQRSQERGVFGEVIGVRAQVLAQLGQDLSCRILDIDAEAGGPRITTRPPVAVGDDSIENRGRKPQVREVGFRRHRLRLT